MSDEQRKLMTAREYAQTIGVSAETVRQWIFRTDDPIPSVPVGRKQVRRKVVVEAADSWFARQSK